MYRTLIGKLCVSILCILKEIYRVITDLGCNALNERVIQSQRTHNAIITSLLRQNDVVTSFWRNNEVIIASCVRWDGMTCKSDAKEERRSPWHFLRGLPSTITERWSLQWQTSRALQKMGSRTLRFFLLRKSTRHDDKNPWQLFPC